MTEQDLESLVRSIEGALCGLPEGSCLYQYTRVMSGFPLPRQGHYSASRLRKHLWMDGCHS